MLFPFSASTFVGANWILSRSGAWLKAIAKYVTWGVIFSG